MKSEKQKITQALKVLNEYGFRVINFNSNRKMARGTIGMTDYLIIGRGIVRFIEVKIGKDRLDEVQESLMKFLLEQVARSEYAIQYFILTSAKEASHYVDKWLAQK